MNQAILDPQISVGGVRFGDNIENYPDHKLESRGDASIFTRDCYSFAHLSIEAFVEDTGKIETLRCDAECIWKGINLIGLKYSEFEKLYPHEPAEHDRLLVLDNDEEQMQDVYEYEDLGLQIWVYKQKIVVIMAGDYEGLD